MADDVQAALPARLSAFCCTVVLPSLSWGWQGLARTMSLASGQAAVVKFVRTTACHAAAHAAGAVACMCHVQRMLPGCCPQRPHSLHGLYRSGRRHTLPRGASPSGPAPKCTRDFTGPGPPTPCTPKSWTSCRWSLVLPASLQPPEPLGTSTSAASAALHCPGSRAPWIHLLGASAACTAPMQGRSAATAASAPNPTPQTLGAGAGGFGAALRGCEAHGDGAQPGGRAGNPGGL